MKTVYSTSQHCGFFHISKILPLAFENSGLLIFLIPFMNTLVGFCLFYFVPLISGTIQKFDFSLF